MARTKINVTRVVRKARSRKYPTKTPLTKPTAAPTTITAGNTSTSGNWKVVHQRDGSKIAERKIRADAQIDAAGEQHDRHTERRKQILAELPTGVG